MHDQLRTHVTSYRKYLHNEHHTPALCYLPRKTCLLGYFAFREFVRSFRQPFTACTVLSTHAGLMLGQRRRRWSNIKPALAKVVILRSGSVAKTQNIGPKFFQWCECWEVFQPSNVLYYENATCM